MDTRAPTARRLASITLVLLGVALSSSSASARAQQRSPQALALTWTAPDDCPTHAQMMERITALLAGDTSADAGLDARVVVMRDDDFHVSADVVLSAGGTTNRRAVSAPSCEAVAEALALIIALAVNRNTPEAAPAAPIAEASLLATPRAPAKARARRFALGASVLVDARFLPSVSVGAELALAWHPAHWQLEAGAAYLAPERARLPSRPAEGADLSAVRAGMRGCYDPLAGSWELGPCAGLGVQWLLARGFGSREPADATGVIVDATLGARAHARLTSRLGLRLVAEALVPFSRATVIISHAGDVYRTPPASFRASGGAELRF